MKGRTEKEMGVHHQYVNQLEGTTSDGTEMVCRAPPPPQTQFATDTVGLVTTGWLDCSQRVGNQVRGAQNLLWCPYNPFRFHPDSPPEVISSKRISIRAFYTHLSKPLITAQSPKWERSHLPAFSGRFGFREKCAFRTRLQTLKISIDDWRFSFFSAKTRAYICIALADSTLKLWGEKRNSLISIRKKLESMLKNVKNGLW